MARFDPGRPGYLENPYPALARLRAEEPIHRSPDLQAWVITRYDDVEAILRDPERFSSDPEAARGGIGEGIRAQRERSPLGDVAIMGNSDGAVHERLRGLVNRAFTPRAVASFEPETARFSSDLLGRVRSGEPFDAMKVVCEPLAVISTLAFLGVPPQLAEPFRAWSGAVMRARSEANAPPEVIRHAAAAEGLLGELLRGVQANPPAEPTVLSTLLAAEEAGEVSLSEVAMMLIHISLAGNGPTALALANALHALALHPDAFAAVREEPGLVDGAVEETLRWDSATHFLARWTTAPVTMRDRRIPAGQAVYIGVGAANRDPEVFADPDRFDVRREGPRGLSFGYGVHFCLGAPIARLELRALIAQVTAGFTSMQLAAGGIERAPGLLLRGPRRLWLVAWD